MRSLPPLQPAASGRQLSRILKAIRRQRRLRPPQLAERMGMPLRSYEHFEAGRGRLNLERIHAFAEATGSDGFAILAALSMGSPHFALRAADNKLAHILLMALQGFDDTTGDDIARLPPRTLIAAFDQCFAQLAELARRPQRGAASGLPPEANSHGFGTEENTAAPGAQVRHGGSSNAEEA